MTRERLPLTELQTLIDPIYEKFMDGTESGEIAFGIELDKLLSRAGWTRDEFMDELERLGG